MATAPDLMTEPVKTRVWRDLTVSRSDAQMNPIEPPVKKTSAGQTCVTKDDVMQYVAAKHLVGTKKQFFQEIWTDDVVNLLVDIDDKHCPTEEAMHAKIKEYSDWVLATCAEKLSMNKHDLDEQVAISHSPGTCFNYYPEPVEDGKGSEPVWKLVTGKDDWTTKDPASASPQELKKYYRYALSKKEKEAGKTEADARFNHKYKTLRYKAGIHAVINGFTCRFGSQFDYFTQEGWVASCPNDTLGEPSLDNIYSARHLLRMLNNKKTDTDKRPKVPMTLGSLAWMSQLSPMLCVRPP